MAEKLLQAIGRGVSKSTTEKFREARKSAAREFDPVMFRSLYKAGLIGPLLKSVVQEYKQTEKTEKEKSKKVQQPGVISSNVSTSLQSMSVQLSAIADVMEDIRELTKAQLLVDRNFLKQSQLSTRQEQLKSIEEKLESVKRPSLSLTGKAPGEKQTGAIGGLFGFIKDNPILSALIAGGLLAASKDLQKFFSEFRERSGIDKDIKNAVGMMWESITKVTGDVITGIAKSITESIYNQLPSWMRKFLPSMGKTPTTAPGENARDDIMGRQVTPESSISSTIGGIVAGGILGRIGGGLASKLIFGTGTKFGQKAAGVAGLGGAGIGAFLGGGGDSLGEAAALAGYAGLAYGTSRMLSRAPTATPPAIPTTTPAATGRPVIVSGTERMTPLERSKMFAERAQAAQAAQAGEKAITKTPARFSFSNLSTLLRKVIDKVGLSRLVSFLAVRGIAVGTGALLGGPVGIAIALITLGPVVWDILNDLLEGEEKLEGAREKGIVDTTATGEVPSLKPPVAGLAQDQTQMATAMRPGEPGYEEYRRKLIMQESGGQNIQNLTGSQAFGKYQILPSTFEQMKKNVPSLKDVSWDEFKSNPAIQDKVFDALTASNAMDLERAGLPANAFNLYLAHRLGSGAAIRVLKADPSQNLITTGYKDFKMQSMVYQQNPDMREKTVGQFLQERQVKFGLTATAPTPATSFKADQAKSTDEFLNKVLDISGLSAFNTLAELEKKIAPVVIENPGGSKGKNTGVASRSETPPVSPYQPGKDYLRIGIDPNFRNMGLMSP